jgi:hypothetical protein
MNEGVDDSYALGDADFLELDGVGSGVGDDLWNDYQ